MILEEKKKFIINFTYFVIVASIIYLLFKMTYAYLLPFIVGFLISFSVQKPAFILSKKTVLKKQTWAAILSVLIFLAFIFFFSFISWLLYSQFIDFVNNISSRGIINQIEQLYSTIKNIVNKNNLAENGTVKLLLGDALSSTAAKIGNLLTGIVTDLIKNLPGLLIACVITVVATCYISKDFDKLSLFAKEIIGNKISNKLSDFKIILTDCVLKFLSGYFKLFCLTFIELIIGLFLLGAEHLFVLAFLIALVDLLPVLGTGTVLLPWAITEFLQKNYYKGIGVVLIYITITVIRNFLEPKIIGEQFDINPIFTLIFLFLGFRIGGVIGMLALPLLFTVFFTYYRNKFSNNV